MSQANARAVKVRAFVQARMTSKRFPGKVLAPLDGKPIIAHLLCKVKRVLPSDHITVLTSTQNSDDPLAVYVRSLGISVFRGPIENVFERFRLCLKEFPCTWFVRICADSPFLDSSLLSRLLEKSTQNNFDLVTNVQVRTFPKGQSIELINSKTFTKVDPRFLNSEEREHITKIFYTQTHKYKIHNTQSSDPYLAEQSLAIDTVADLQSLEEKLRSGQLSTGEESTSNVLNT